MNRISIECEGAELRSIDELLDFQGGLKSLSDTALEKFKRNLVELGFSIPIAIWRHKGKAYILDGHQRLKALRSLEQDGYEIPDAVPVSYIKARTRTEAKKKLLAFISQYGRVATDELDIYLADAEIELFEVKELMEIPGIKLETPTGLKTDDLMETTYELVVEFETEDALQKAFERFTQEGYTCRLSIL